MSLKMKYQPVKPNDAFMGVNNQWDSHGRMKSYSPAVPAGYGMLEYTWNSIGQKTSMKVPVGVGNVARMLEYRYDNSGRQVGLDVKMSTSVSSTGTSASVPGNTTRFFYDSSQNRTRLINKAGDVYQYVYDPTASFPAAVYEQGPEGRYVNVREPDGALVSREKYDGLGQRVANSIYHFDGLGSTRAISDGEGNITDTYSYDAWGNTTHTSGTTADNPYQYVGRYGYYSHYQEPDFHLLQLGVRYYDPEMGRFTSRDPVVGSLETYIYTGNYPLSAIDNNGMDRTVIDWILYYYFGGGIPLDLAKTGLMDDVRNAMYGDILDYKFYQLDMIYTKADAACKANPKKRSIRVEFNTDTRKYNPNFTLVPKLFALGSSRVSAYGWCTMTVDCCTRKTRYCCYSRWSLKDRIKDGVDWFDLIPPWITDIDLPGSSPFEVYANWYESKCATVGF